MSDALSWAVRVHVEEVCTRFESAWQAAGPPPRIEDYLAEATGPEGQALMWELLLLDLHYRRRRGEQPDALEYTARFPAAGDLVGEALAARGPSVPRPAVAESTDAPSRAGPAQAGSTEPEGGGAAGAAAAGPSNPTIPGYEFRGELGRGGMGAVIRCRDLHLDRDLAVKVLLDRYKGEPHLVQRFLAEARIHGRLQHPGVVPVHELGELPDRRPYFTMKLVEGRTLADLLKERADATRDLPRFLTIFEQVCQTLAYAHSKRIIHRDLKPSNVMVGAFGEVQVMDWGLAKVLKQGGQAAAADETPAADGSPAGNGDLERVTQPGAVLGTYAYMAPEQARGEVERLDERSDVFGLGAILCEVLTGNPPFAGANSEELSARAQACDHAAAFAALDTSGADGELLRLAKGCLAADLAERPRDAGAVAAAMAAYLAGVQERLRRAELERATAQARAVEERKRRRVALGLAAAVLALLAAGAGGGLFVQHQAAERRAERQASQARRDAEQRQAVEFALEKAVVLRQQAHWREAQAVLEQARHVLGDAGPDDLRQRLDVADGELVLVNRLDAIRQRRAAIGEGEFDTRTAAHDFGVAFREAGLGAAGDDEETVAARVSTSGVAAALVAALDDWAAVTPDPDKRAWILGVARRAAPDSWGDRFRTLAVWQDRQALQGLADEALRDDGAKLGELSPQALAVLGVLLGDGDKALPLLRAAQRRYPGDFWLNIHLGYALYSAKNWEEAVAYSRVAVALRPDSALAHNNLGGALNEQGRWREAEAAYREAIRLRPDFPLAHYGLGGALNEQGRYKEGEAACREAIRLKPDSPLAHSNLGAALGGQGRWQDAEAACREAIRQKPDSALAHSNLGGALAGQGRWREAEAAYREAIRLRPDYPLAHYGLGGVLNEQGRYKEGEAACREAIRLKPDSPLAHSNLGSALGGQGRWQDAEAACREAIRQKPDFALAHNNLGSALGSQGRYKEAEMSCREAIRLKPDFAQAHCNLGHALREQGCFAEALSSLRRGHALGSKVPGWSYPSADWVQQCEGLAAADKKLSAVLSGQAEPANAAEGLALGQLCQQHKHRHAAAVRFYANAFAADPRLAADLRQPHRYNAACSAALAAAGEGEDAKNLPDKVRVMMRRQALDWLRADLALWAKVAGRAEPAAKQAVRQTLTHWRQDTDLASVRDRAALDRLPDDERQQWRALWSDVAALLAKAGTTPP
jgi:serine/threonine-protein kinase